VKVLLVDDSGLSRKVQAKVLKELGLQEVLEAKNGLEALRKLEEVDWAVSLVITDWNMPGMDGITLIEEIRKSPRGRGLAIIVISSEFQEDRIGRAFQAGANSYVTKPFKKDVLLRKIESVRAIANFDAPAPTGESLLMEGELERLGFAELIGFLNFSSKSGELLIQLGGSEAGVSLENGEVRDAWIGRFASEDAFFAIARLKSGHFAFHEGRAVRQQRISRPTMTLLMEAVKLQDPRQRPRVARPHRPASSGRVDARRGYRRAARPLRRRDPRQRRGAHERSALARRRAQPGAGPPARDEGGPHGDRRRAPQPRRRAACRGAHACAGAGLAARHALAGDRGGFRRLRGFA
jgi:two-component system chemotaxis response regulator CheY